MAAPRNNKNAIGNHGGKPRKFETPEVLEAVIQDYFDSCYITKIDDNGDKYQQNIKPLTVSGLAVFMGTNRQTLMTYQDNYGIEYHDAISRAKAKIESFAAESLFTAKSAQGIMFSLKNNYDWRDKQEIDTNVSGDITVTFANPDLDDWAK